MRKLIFVILATAGILFGMSSCHKYCQCNYYESDVLILEDYPEEITGEYKNCIEYEIFLNRVDDNHDKDNKTVWRCYKY